MTNTPESKTLRRDRARQILLDVFSQTMSMYADIYDLRDGQTKIIEQALEREARSNGERTEQVGECVCHEASIADCPVHCYLQNEAKPSIPTEDEIDQAARSIWREIIEEQAFKAGVQWLRDWKKK